jgi:hypothetical protein
MMAIVLGVALLATALATRSASAEYGIFDASTTPTVLTGEDQEPVELGVRFSSTSGGSVTGIEFYRSSGNVGPHTATLWDASGTALASAEFPEQSRQGWQTARFQSPVPIEPGETYVASYLAPEGGYSSDINGFDSPVSHGDLTAPVGAGVYRYGGGFPQESYLDSNYYVDVLFTDEVADPPGQSALQPAEPSDSTPQTSEEQPLDLPRIPWEGGPDYWKQFPIADAAGWDDPGFFPILAWFNGISSDEEVQYDKSLGINTYSGMWEGTPYDLFERNDVYWVGGQLNETFTSESTNWVGHFLDDEVDGRFPPEEGRAHLQKIVDSFAGDGRFDYANYTQMVISTDLAPHDAEAFVNDYTDVVSVDMYWYTIPYCSLTPYRDTYLAPVKKANCRTASSYGKTMDSLRMRDATDGTLQPLWQWVENVNGGPGEGPFTANVTEGQLTGAVMSSLISEARGIAYFNQSHSGPCQSGAVFRESQAHQDFCGAEQVAAAKNVNAQIKELAPVLNSQSYEYSFGRGLDTMLKTYQGDAYVFAMVDGESQPGDRTFRLPPGVTGKTVEVLFEDRSIVVDPARTFTDDFEKEYSYHIYRITQ